MVQLGKVTGQVPSRLGITLWRLTWKRKLQLTYTRTETLDYGRSYTDPLGKMIY